MLTTLTSWLRASLAKVNLVSSRRPPFLFKLYPFRNQAQMERVLGDDLGAGTIWSATDGPMPSGELANIFETTVGVHKWVHYLAIHERVLAPYRQRPIHMLEIGVAHGGSLKIWRRFLHSESTIVGIDIDPACAKSEDAESRVYVRIGAQQDEAFLRRVIDEFGPFDVILDDGSHMASHTVKSFRFLFLNALTSGGTYLVEDLHTSYWTEYRDSPLTFIDFTKWLIDALHAHYPQTTSEPEFRVGSPERRAEVTVPLATLLIENIEIHDSLAVIRRANGQRELPRSQMNHESSRRPKRGSGAQRD